MAWGGMGWHRVARMWHGVYLNYTYRKIIKVKGQHNLTYLLSASIQYPAQKHLFENEENLINSDDFKSGVHHQ